MSTNFRRVKSSWIGIGFSHHSVPSLSNTAIRSSGATAADSANSTIACLVGVSLQELRCWASSATLLGSFSAGRVIDHHPPWVMWGHPRARERGVVGEAIGQILSLAVAVAVSPIPIIGVVLMLATPRARSNGPAFLVGWIAGLALLGTVVLLVSSGANASDNGQPHDWVSILKLVLGVLLLLVAVRQWRGRPRGDQQAELPKWMQAIDTFTAPKALAMGALLAAVNPKNGLLTIAAGAAIAGTGISAGEQAGALAVFIAIATLGVAAPLVVYFALGSRSARCWRR